MLDRSNLPSLEVYEAITEAIMFNFTEYMQGIYMISFVFTGLIICGCELGVYLYKKRKSKKASV